MIWSPRAGRTAKAAGSALSPELWAARDRLGPVPAGWVGLRVTPDGCAGWAEAGQALSAPRWGSDGAVAWWVRAEPCQVVFAPRPHLAPEAGLVVALQLDTQAGVDHRHLLAVQLAAEPGDLTLEHWSHRLREHEVIRELPPCATPLQLSNRAETLGRLLRCSWMVQVGSLRRCDLAVPDEADEPGADAADVTDPGAAAPGSGRALGATPVSQGQQSVPKAAVPTWEAALAQDHVACQSLSRGLPGLEFDLQQRWLGTGWSDAPAVAARQRAISQRLGLMASTLGRWPSIDPRPGARRAIGAAERGMVALQALRAMEALVAAEQALAALPPARTAPLAEQLQPLEDALDVLQANLLARQLPWWE